MPAEVELLAMMGVVMVVGVGAALISILGVKLLIATAIILPAIALANV